MAKKWFYLHGGKTEGPVGSDVLQKLALAGTIGPQDEIWPEGSSRDAAVEAQSALLFPVSDPDLPPVPEPPPAPPEPAPAKPLPAAGLPDWLTDVQTGDERPHPHHAPVEEVQGNTAIPDWLQDFLGKPAAVPPPPPDTSAAEALAAKPTPPAPPPPDPEPAPPSELTGIDPSTGRVLDAEKFERWLADQNVVRKTRLAMEPIPSLHERLQKAKYEIEQWADDEANRAVIVSADLKAIRADAALGRILSSYSDWGPEMTDKLWRHVAFVVENRKKFYASRPGGG